MTHQIPVEKKEHLCTEHLVDTVTLPLTRLKNFLSLAMEGADGKTYQVCDIAESLLDNALSEILTRLDEIEQHHGSIFTIQHNQSPEMERAGLAGKCIGVEVRRNGSPVALFENGQAATRQGGDHE